MLFSIITVHLNDFSGLRATTESLYRQNLTDYEQIVVDGKSPNFSQIESWLRSNKRTKVISEKDHGLYDAMNKGLRNANGEFLIFMNSGDIFADSEVLTDVKEIIGNSNPKFIYGNTIEVDVAGSKRVKLARHWRLSFWTTPTRQQSMFFRRDAIRNEFRTEYSVVADVAFVYEFLKNIKSNQIVRANRTISEFRQGGVSYYNDKKVAKEGWDVRRKIMGFNLVQTAFIVAGHGLIRIIKRALTD